MIGASSSFALAPDGTVFAAAQHDPQSYGDDTGIFMIHPNDGAPAWTPLAPGGVHCWQATVTPAGLRLWGVGAFGSETRLKYVDVA